MNPLKSYLIILYLLILFGRNVSAQDAKQIAITFDDLPIVLDGITSDEMQRKIFNNILNTLDKYDIKAYGFVAGKKIKGENQIKLLEEFINRGHALGNHSFNHPDLNNTAIKNYQDDILKCDSLLQPFMSGQKYFRYPLLHRGNSNEKKQAIYKFLVKNNYKIASVSIDNDDYSFNIPARKAYFSEDTLALNEIRKKYLEHMKSRIDYFRKLSHDILSREMKHVLLLHMNFLNSIFLDDLLILLSNEGWEFITLEEALEDPAYSIYDNYCGEKGLGWLERIPAFNDTIPEMLTSRMGEVPDIMQMDSLNDFPDNGRCYCAPVSASNYLVWLGQNGFPGLSAKEGSDKEKVLSLAKVLGNKKYMNVSCQGIPPSIFLNKTAKYIKDCGYQIDYLNYWGFDHYSSAIKPDLNQIKKELQNNGMVWLLVGRYSFDVKSNTFNPISYHYIAVIGYGIDKNNNRSTNHLIVNCSSPRSGYEYSNEFISLNRLKTGKLEDNTSIEGFYEITDGLLWKRDDEKILINGIIGLKVKK